MQPSSKSNTCFAAVIRHGERVDHIPNYNPADIPNEHDPSLTDFGFEQAKLTGKYLKEYFDTNGMNFDKVIIECSPFIRTMQTASQIARELNVPTITYNF